MWAPRAPAGLTLQVDDGLEAALERGAVAQGFQRVVPAPVNVVRMETPLPAELGWRLRAGAPERPPCNVSVAMADAVQPSPQGARTVADRTVARPSKTGLWHQS